MLKLLFSKKSIYLISNFIKKYEDKCFYVAFGYTNNYNELKFKLDDKFDVKMILINDFNVINV